MSVTRRLLGAVAILGGAALLAPAAAQGITSGSGTARVLVPSPDLAAARAEDAQREAEGLPPRYAIPHATFLSPAGDGAWDTVGGGTRVWRLGISSPGALSLNLGFTAFWMPPGGELRVRAADGRSEVGPYTAADNAAHGELWTPVVPADDIVVELRVPAAAADQVVLELTSINVGYRFFGETAEGRSGSCNVDVVCPEGDAWQNEIPAVGVISTGGSLFCTGFMVNNTAQDGTPYFMTANHCGVSSGNAASLVVYWNYESPTCGQQGGGSLSQNQTGSYFRASYNTSDFTLVELDSLPNPAWGISYAGWDRSTDNPTSACAIHHPETDEKSISFEYQACTTTSYLGTSTPGNGSHIRVIDWDVGTTEPGSSGSPLFNQNHHVVGQLHGGYAACGNNQSDWYGRFSKSWTGGGSNSTRLSNWLDPLGTAPMTLDTYVPGGCDAAAITAHPSGLTRCTGQPATFSVTAAGTEPLSYQWRKNSANITGATGTSYTIASVGIGDAASYDCVVTNGCGSATSNAATLAVNTPVGITAQPFSQTRCAGQTVSFSVGASGTAPTYQWRKNTVNITGASNPVYIIPFVGPGDAASYDCVVTNACSSATSNAATLTVNTAASVSSHPQNLTRCAGQSATFTVTAGGTAPFTYRWRKNTADIDGATGSSYTITAVAPADAASYDCVVTNGCGSATSNAAALAVGSAPQISGQPGDQTVTAGGAASFGVTASGADAYRWYRDDAPLSDGGAIGGALTATLTIDPVGTGDNGAVFYCLMTNGCGSTASDTALLTVTPGVCRGDCDCDGTVSFSDIDFFVAAIPENEAAWAALFPGGTPPPGCTFANCDVNASGTVGFDDIDPFVALIPSACP